MSMLNTRQRPNIMRHIGLSSGEAQDMRVETRIIEPRTFSQSTAGGQMSFDLPKEGLLDQDVFLDIQMTNPAFGAAGSPMGMPIMAGILGCLQTGTIYYNNILLQQTTELAQLLQLKMCFVEQDIRDQTYQVKIGSFSGLMTDTDSLTAAGATSVGKYSFNASNTGIGIVGLQEGVITATGALNPDQYDKVPDYRIAQGQIRIVFDFYPDLNGNRGICYSFVPPAGAAPVAGNFISGQTITQSSCRLVVDLVYFDDIPGQPSPMERLAAEVMSGIELVYTDYTFIESVISAGTGGANPELKDVTTLCGLDHQVVRNLLVAIPNRVDYTALGQDAPNNAIWGNFGSCASQGQTTLQIVINNQNVYPNGLTSWVGSVTGAALNAEVPQEAFPRDKWMCGLGPGAGAAVFSSGQSCIQGSLQYMGVNLSRTHDNVLGAGTAIGKSPVEVRLTLQQTQQVARARRLMIWAECERVMIIKGGQIMVSGS